MEAKIKTLLSAILPVYTEFVPVPIPDGYIYMKSDSIDDEKALNGYTGLLNHSFTLDLIVKEYINLITYYKQVLALLKSIEGTTQTYYIQSVKIDPNCPELWESEVKMNRKIISFTISYHT